MPSVVVMYEAFAGLFAGADITVWTTMFTVWAFVAACTVVGYSLPALRGERGRSTRQAITTWWPVTIVGALGCLCGPLASVVVLTLVGIVVARESLLLLTEPSRERPLHLLLVIAAVVAGTVVAVLDRSVDLVVVPLLVVVPALQLWRGGTASFAKQTLAVVQAGVVGGVLWSYVARLVFHGPGPHAGQGAITVFFVLVMMADAMQYVAGKLFGRTPLAPKTSPKKTVEGLVGGMVIVSAIGAFLVPHLLHRSLLEGAVVGAVVVVVGLVGDLVMSAYKRDAGRKDSSALLPGQGGALDRCDSIVMCAPLYWAWLTSTTP